ncbi:hypothetical protein N0V86_003228 [Didymella sp. IMI 355093]|nr:hypothetical protein N0V86_003228 [Didymella sp. IMI 355093]
MTGFLDLPLELRNYVYDLLLHENLNPSFRGVMVVSEAYVKRDLPLKSYRGLLLVCHQLYQEFKTAIQHFAASKQLNYELDITFSHGRPYFSLTWKRFIALSPIINHLFINVDLRIQEPLGASEHIPHDQELAHLIENRPKSFAVQLFDYIAILLKSLFDLLLSGNPDASILYTETMTLNLRTPTRLTLSGGSHHNPHGCSRRIPVDKSEAAKLWGTMRNTLQATSKDFQAFEARKCEELFPRIQIGCLRFATEDRIWGEGHNLILAERDFMWLKY